MEWMDEVRAKAARKNQVLFSHNNPLIQQVQRLADQQNHRTLILWAFELADETVETLRTRYPGEARPQNTVALCRAWAAGEIKMPVAKRAILDTHAFAKEITSPEDIALCHAVGQACSVVHTVGHAVGFPVYELTALVRRHGIDGCAEIIERRAEAYCDRMRHWRQHHADHPRPWADFMLRD